MAQSEGFYMGAAGGASFPASSKLKGGGTSAKTEFNAGWAAMLNGGYAYGNGIRTELELAHRDNGVDSVGKLINSGGDARATTLMANLNYDIDTNTPFTPFVGIGLGGARVELDDVRPVVNNRVADDDMVFAYQGIVGASYRITDAVNMFADYRYLRTLESEMSTDNGVKVDVPYTNHTVMVGLRYAFGAPRQPQAQAAAPVAPAPAPMVQAPPPPPPPPAPVAAPRNYLVFFDFDRATLTPEAEGILARAASSAREGNVTRIEATGHADRSGSPRYNASLSKRRADAVRRDLVRRGVPEREIAVSAMGESQPLVPTADGVREPQNRRVEIVLR